jgi:WD40 repeat protein
MVVQMLQPLLPIRIFLSSPGDLFPVRAAVKRVVEELNRDLRYEDRYKFILYAYEDRVPPVIAEEPQVAVDRYTLRPDAPDIFLCLFWKRLGTPTAGLDDPETGAPYPSGTAYELLTAYRARRGGRAPAILLYRCTAPAQDETMQAPRQEQALDAFLARFQAGGDLVGLANATFTDASEHAVDLVNQLRDDLMRVVEVDLHARLDDRSRRLSRPQGAALLLPANLPSDYVERTDPLNELRRLVLGSQRRVGVVAMQGQGGVGKTVLAKALCFDRTTRGAFSDGILWAELGQQPDLLAIQRDWIRVLGGDPNTASTVQQGTAVLQALLQDRAMLLVLDNVWQRTAAEALQVGGTRCCIVITSRDAGTAPGTQLLPLTVMHRDESKQLLRLSAGRELDEEVAEDVAQRLGDLPLALELVGGQLRHGVAWKTIRRELDLHHDVRYLGLEQGQVYEVIAASVASLPARIAARFRELVIFPRRQPLDAAALARFWQVGAGLDEGEIAHCLAIFRARALLQPGDIIHDLVHDFLELGFRDAPDQLRTLHWRLAMAYGDPNRWPDLPLSESFAWQYLAKHIVASGRAAKAAALLTDGRHLLRKIALHGSDSAARDVDLIYDDLAKEPRSNSEETLRRLHLLAAALRRSAHVLDNDPSQVELQLFGRLGTESPLHEMPPSPWYLVWPTLSSASGAELRAFAHRSIARSCAFSPDGQLLATASSDGTARLWKVATGQQLHLLVHDDQVRSCAFSPDGRLLATASWDGTARLWDVATGQVKQILAIGDHGRSCAFSPDGQLLVTASDGGTKMWKVESWQERQVLFTDEPTLYCTFSPDGRLLATGDGRGTRLWEVASGQLVRAVDGRAAPQSCTFSPDSRFLAMVGIAAVPRLWDVENGQDVHSFGFLRVTNGCAFSPDGSKLAVACHDGVTRIYDVASERELCSLTGHGAGMLYCAFSPDGQLLATAGMDWMVRLWDVGAALGGASAMRPKAGIQPPEFTDAVTDCEFSPDGRLLAAAAGDGAAVVVELANGHELHRLNCDSASIGCALFSCAFSPDGHMLATTSDKATQIWEVETGRQLLIPSGKSDFMFSCAFSPNGHLLAAAGHDGVVCLWSVASGRKLRSFKGHTDDVSTCKFSPDGRLLATASWDGTVRLWDVASGQEVYMVTHEGGVNDCAFSSNGHMLVTGGQDGIVHLWEVVNIQELRSMTRFWIGAVVNTCTFSYDNRFLAIGTANGVAHLWAILSHKPLARFTADGSLSAGAAQPNGLHFAFGDTSGRVHLLTVGATSSEITLT